MKFARKGLVWAVKNADQGLVEAVFATFGVKDHDGDWTLPGAFKVGAMVALSPFGHNSVIRGLPPVGKGVIRVDGDKVICDGQFNLKMESGRETFEAVKDMGELQEWSYAYNVLATGEVTEDMRQKGVRRVLKTLDAFEVSPVLRGAGVDTQTLDVKEIGDEEVIDPAASGELVQFLRTKQRLARI